MAFTYQSNIWDIAGEYTFEESGITLLNPSLEIKVVTIYNNVVQLQLNVTENGGVFNHFVNISQQASEESDVNLLVEDIIAAKFPNAVLRV